MSCMALVKRPVSAHFDPSPVKMDRRKALNLPPPVNKQDRSHVTSPFRPAKRKPSADSSCWKMESPPAQKKHWTELSSTDQKSAEASPVNGSDNRSRHRSPKCKAGTSCLHARLILTDVLKTRLGQQYLNRGSLGLRTEPRGAEAINSKSSKCRRREVGDLQGEAPSFGQSRESPVRGQSRESPVRGQREYSPTPSRTGHQMASDTSCLVEESPFGTYSPKPRSCSVALRGLSVEMCRTSKRSLDWQRGHSLEDEASTALEMGEGGVLPGGAGHAQCHSGCEGSPSQATEIVRREDSSGFWANGIRGIEVGTPCIPRDTRTQSRDPPSEITDRRASARRICLTDDLATAEQCRARDQPEPQDGERSPSGSHPSHDRPGKPKSSPPEPIVLSSDDEEGKDAKEDVSLAPAHIPGPSILVPGPLPQDSPSTLEHHDELGEMRPDMLFRVDPHGRKNMSKVQVSTLLELPFCELLVGGVTIEAGGDVMISDQGITIPLKASSGKAEFLSVALVPTHLRRYGLWNSHDQGDAGGPGRPLLFLWVSDAELELLQGDLSALHLEETLGTGSPFLLLTLREPLDGIHEALLGSLMDLMSLRNQQPELMQPLSLDEGLALISSGSGLGCSLLSVLRVEPQNQTRAASSQVEAEPQLTAPPEQNSGRPRPNYTLCHRRTNDSYAVSMSLMPDTSWSRYQHQGQASRLILFPPPPRKGGITVTTEDLQCLDSGVFLNDVIIDFYLKYLVLEKAPKEMAQRSHVFSSFFYKQLTRKDNASEESSHTSARHRRHQRVRTWTRNVDIFSKDFLFIPVNQESHWYLVVICFPGLEEPQSEEWSSPAVGEMSGVGSGNECQAEERALEDPELKDDAISLFTESGGPHQGRVGGGMEEAGRMSLQTPECTQLGCRRDTICKRSCILLMDSLKLYSHERVLKLLREYLEVEWEVRRGTPRAFTPEMTLGFRCWVPLQDNSSDCGLYLLQYAESFLENPVVHFDPPFLLERWFPRQKVRRKREEIRDLVLWLFRKQWELGGRAR